MNNGSDSTGELSLSEKRELLARLLQERASSSASNNALSYGQQALWFLYQLAPESTAYNVVALARILSPLDVGIFRRAFQLLVERHAILRASFATLDGEPIYRISENHVVDLEFIDSSHWSEKRLEEYLNEQIHLPFDLEQGPVYRVALFARPDNQHVFSFVVHHIAFDGYCHKVIMDDLSRLYSAIKNNTGVPPRPTDVEYQNFVRWQQEMVLGAEGERQKLYWKKKLAGNLPALDMPTDRPRQAVQRYRGATVPLAFDEKTIGAVNALAKREKITLYPVLLAAFQALLHRYTGEQEILVGAPTLGRTRSDFENIVGYFVNPVVFRAHLSGEQTFVSLLRQVRETVVEGLAHQDYPFPLLVKDLDPDRDPSRNPVFQAMIDWRSSRRRQRHGNENSVEAQNGPGPEFDWEEFKPEALAIGQHEGQVDLALDIKEVEGSLFGDLKYDTDLFDADTAVRMQGHFQTLLAAATAHPEQRIADLPLLSEPERQHLLIELNRTAREYPHALCTHQLFEAQVERRPEAIAVACDGRQHTYMELNRRANQLAHRLVSLDVGPDEPVGIFVDRSIDMLVGLLGIMKADGAYVPLDPSFPWERLTYMLEDSGARVLLTQQHLAASLPATDLSVICLDSDWNAISKESDSNLKVAALTSENLAYVIYTSGSTGKPKGVEIAHRNVANFLNSMRRRPGLAESDVLLAVTTISFDIHVLELFLPLTVGARVEVITRDVLVDGKQLLDRMRSSGATIMQATPTTWQMLIDSGWNEQLNLKVLCGGEALSSSLARQLLERASSVWNMYGPTETTVWSSISKLEPDDATITIGQPIDNTQLYVLDKNIQPRPIGHPGELYIGGDGLARRYRNLPAQTAERFVPDPFSDDPEARLYKTGDLSRYRADGTVEVIGRIDFQVKIRGFRIELEEIESVLCEYPEVKSAVTVVYGEEVTDRRLVAYIIGDLDSASTTTDLRSFLRRKLPEYMVPTDLVRLDEFPLTPNGKIDRKALPAPERTRGQTEVELVTPSGALETVMAQIWKDVLEVDDISAFDTFFDLGGHSLLSLKVVDRFERETGWRLNPAELVGQTLRQVVSRFEGKIKAEDKSEAASLKQKMIGAIKSAIFQKN